MTNTKGISFLYAFDFGNRDYIQPGSNILSVTSTAAGDFDKANLTTESLRHVWRSTAVNDWQEIIIQADLTSNIDTLAILGHNFTPSAIVQVQANIANNFMAPPISFYVPYQKDNMVLCRTFGAAYGFYKIRILDPSNPCGYVQVGRVIGGRAFTFTNNEDMNDDFTVDYNDLADTQKTEGFFRVSNNRVKVKTLTVSFAKIKTAIQELGDDINYVGLKTMLDTVGKTMPFLTIVDRDDPGFYSLWGQLTDLPGHNHTINRFVSLSLRIEEVF